MLQHSKEALLQLKMVRTDCQVKIKLTLVVGENKHFDCLNKPRFIQYLDHSTKQHKATVYAVRQCFSKAQSIIHLILTCHILYSNPEVFICRLLQAVTDLQYMQRMNITPFKGPESIIFRILKTFNHFQALLMLKMHCICCVFNHQFKQGRKRLKALAAQMFCLLFIYQSDILKSEM